MKRSSLITPQVTSPPLPLATQPAPSTEPYTLNRAPLPSRSAPTARPLPPSHPQTPPHLLTQVSRLQPPRPPHNNPTATAAAAALAATPRARMSKVSSHKPHSPSQLRKASAWSPLARHRFRRVRPRKDLRRQVISTERYRNTLGRRQQGVGLGRRCLSPRLRLLLVVLPPQRRAVGTN